MSRHSFDLAVIGVGATGISLLKQLQDEVFASNLKAPKIALFDPLHSFAVGNAFGGAAPMHKVNTPPSMLALSDSEPAGFSSWLVIKQNSNDLYPERLTYSKFLQDTYHSLGENGLLDICEFQESVVSIDKQDFNRFQITSEKDKIVYADKIVLCLGALSGTNFPAFAQNSHLINHHSNFDQVGHGPVIIAGSGLSAVDAVRSLDIDKTREIHLFSRHGFAPTCLTGTNAYRPKELNWSNLLKNNTSSSLTVRQFFDMIDVECESLADGGEKKVATRILKESGLSEYFQYLMGRSKQSDLPYQDILVSTRPYMHKLWRAMPLQERLLFNLKHSTDWAVWRHPIPYDVVNELLDASKNSRLFIHKSAKSPRWDGHKFTLETATGKTITSEYFVDGTGGTNRLEVIDSPLVRDLIYRQLIEANACGGLDVNPLTFECQVKGKSISGLYSLGPLNKGSLFSTNAFWFNARCAGQWVKQWAIEANKQELTGV